MLSRGAESSIIPGELDMRAELDGHLLTFLDEHWFSSLDVGLIVGLFQLNL
jgi:hypothetical protein